MSHLPPEEYRDRWRRARELMDRAGLDALLVTEMHNYWYFTGHHSRQFEHKMRPMLAVVPRDRDPVMIIYGRDEREARAASPIAEMRTYVDVPFPVELMRDTLGDLGLSEGTIGCELGPNHRLGLPYGEFVTIKEELLPHARFVDGSAVISRLRTIKSPREIEVTREACRITLEAWEDATAVLEPGMTTRRVAEILTTAMIEAGGDLHVTGHVSLLLEGEQQHTYVPGERLWCDFGACYRGYHGDIARQAVFGKPTDQQLRDHALIWRITRACIDAIRPGARASDVARACNREMERAGLPPLTGSKRVGHGLGLAVAEPPSLSLADDTILEPGMVLTPEPRYFLPSGERIHIEEDVVVTEDGCDLLTTGAEKLKAIGG
ncbi:MAG: aminopeptidase P family protein [Armatimonadetes bacterium]|nr:aminopeptidase P family protein [Armatimonadota bacterium]